MGLCLTEGGTPIVLFSNKTPNRISPQAVIRIGREVERYSAKDDRLRYEPELAMSIHEGRL
jgi:hypothetical protein